MRVCDDAVKVERLSWLARTAKHLMRAVHKFASPP